MDTKEKKFFEKMRSIKYCRTLAVLVLAAVIVLTVGMVYSASAKEITITEINEFAGLNNTQTVRTHSGNVGEVLEEHGLHVGETDKLNVPADTPVNNKDDIIITRGKRVTIKVGNQENVVTVTKADATDALVEAGYAPGAYDSITIDGETIEIVSVSRIDEATSEPISRGIEYVEDADLPQGSEVVIDEGEDGLKKVRQKVTYLNGEETERCTVSENIIREPRSKIIARGTAQGSVTVASNSQGGVIDGYRYKRKLTMTATAYSTDPCENSGYSVSAMGNALRYGIVAVDPKVIPLGSKVYVTAPDGSWVYGVASAEDTGGAIKGNKIDLCYPNGSDAFGRRNCVVYILE